MIIHLYRGRQRDVVPWGAMRFLDQATTKGRSVQRLEELLLMLLRVAIVAALVLALAQPMLQSTLFGTAVDREVVLVLDNSLSTARTLNEVSTNDELIEQAVEYVEGLSTGDTVHVLLAAGGGQWLTAEGVPAASAGKRQLTSLLQAVEPTQGTANMLDCLQTAVNLEPQGNPSSRQVVVFSDEQALSWHLGSTGEWQQLGAAREQASVPTAIQVVTSQADTTAMKNLAVIGVEAARELVRPKESVELVAQVRNFGESASEATETEWLVADQVFATSELRSLAPGESTRVSAKLRQDEAGNFAVSCRLVVDDKNEADDQIALDNSDSVVIEVSDQLPILVVRSQADEESTKRAEDLFTAALGYDGEQVQDWHSVYQPELATVDQLSSLPLSKYRAVVLLNLSELTAEAQEQLQTFVRSGGGLWVALGDLVQRKAFNRYWYDDGGGMSPISLDSLVTVEDTNKPAGVIHPPDPDHPATSQLANTTQLDIDQARLTEYWQFARANDSERDTWKLLESGDGNPLVVENLVGQGRVLIQAFPLGLGWTNLPQLKSYVVMVQDWLDYLTAPAMARFNLKPGNAIAAPWPAEADSATAILATPAGKQVQLASAGSDASGMVRYSQTQLPGLYQLTFESGGTDTTLPFHVSRDPQESEWQPLNSEAREKLVQLAGVQFEGQQATATKSATNVEPRPRAEPIWGVLLLALVGLLVGEQLLANWLARQRSGVAVT